MRRVLILGGTAEATEVAALLAARPDTRPTLSLAGRTEAPGAQPCETRIGGFGGPEGLATYLRDARVDAVIDATHPFARQISAHAAEACDATGCPRVVLWRAPWEAQEGDRWTIVPTLAEAAKALPTGVCAFLATGRQTVDAFAARPDVEFLVRLVDPPAARLPLPRHTVVIGRGPFDVAAERVLFQTHGVDVVVTKNSGGAGAAAKLEAARTLGVPVILVDRPTPPGGPRVDSAEAAAAWVGQPGSTR